MLWIESSNSCNIHDYLTLTSTRLTVANEIWASLLLRSFIVLNDPVQSELINKSMVNHRLVTINGEDTFSWHFGSKISVTINHQTDNPACYRRLFSCRSSSRVTWRFVHTPTYFPSRPRTASSASLGSSNSTKANPGGFLAIHTVLKGP